VRSRGRWAGRGRSGGARPARWPDGRAGRSQPPRGGRRPRPAAGPRRGPPRVRPPQPPDCVVADQGRVPGVGGAGRARCWRSWLFESEAVVRAAAGVTPGRLVPGAAAERARPGAVAAISDAAEAGRPENAAQIDDDGLAPAGAKLPRRRRALGRVRLQLPNAGDLGTHYRLLAGERAMLL